MRRSEPARVSLKACLAGMTKRRQVACGMWLVVHFVAEADPLTALRVRGAWFMVRGDGDRMACGS